MKKLVFILFFLYLIDAKAVNVSLNFPANSPPSTLGPIVNFCQNYQYLQGVIATSTQSLWTAASPVPPYSGIVVALTQRSNILIDFCSYVMNMATSDLRGQILGTSAYLNTLTGGAYQQNFAMFNSTFSLADSYYDINTGKKRPGGLDGQQGIQKVNDYLVQLRKWNNDRNMTQQDRINADKQQASDMNELVQTAAQNANLKAALNCPNQDSSLVPDYPNIQKTELQPHYDKKSKLEPVLNFYKNQLYSLGRKMLLANVTDYKKYKKEKRKTIEIYPYIHGLNPF